MSSDLGIEESSSTPKPTGKPRGKLFVVSAPAGTGKTTLVSRLVKEMPATVQSISYTTRPKRAGEIDGVHYHFVSRETFQEMVEKDQFLEHVTLYGDFYGTSKKNIEDDLKAGFHVILVIDTQGALELKGKINAFYLFISPPSMAILRKRLEKRRTETHEKIEQRLEVAKQEIQRKDLYDEEIINDDLEQAYQKFKTLIIREEEKDG